jgi:hypothetical protein
VRRLRRVAALIRHNLLGVIALGVAITGVSYAIAASTHSRTLTVCRLRHSRALVVAGNGVKCSGAKVTVGAPGPTGPQGPPGVTGLTGPAGPSNVYFNRSQNQLVPADPSYPTGSGTPVVTLTVPAGTYMVTGKLFAFSNFVAAAFGVQCTMYASDGRLLDTTDGSLAPDVTDVPFFFVSSLTATTSTTVTVKCDSKSDVNVYSPALAATQTASITHSP